MDSIIRSTKHGLRHLGLVAAAVGGLGLGIAQTPSTATPAKTPALVVTLTRRGFEPALLEQKAGQVLLLVNNHTVGSQVTLHVKDPLAQLLVSLPVLPGRNHWQEVVTLLPGNYTLTEDEHHWVCNIIVK